MCCGETPRGDSWKWSEATSIFRRDEALEQPAVGHVAQLPALCGDSGVGWAAAGG
jgi:hypothetical protein